MAMIEVRGLTHRYGRVTALDDVSLEVPEGSLYALLGPNGAGKTTLLQILMGLRRATAGEASVFGRPVGELTTDQRASISYVAEGQRLPGSMRIEQLEAYLAPLYPDWDRCLAADLRKRFRLDPRRRIRTLSRGERMKAALLCALAPRPRLLLMDEPFAGMDVMVKDELVRGLLESAGQEGWTVLIGSHDIGEVEALADHVGFLDDGRLRLSESMDAMRGRFQWVELVSSNGGNPLPDPVPRDWLAVERAGPRARFMVSDGGATLRSVAAGHLVPEDAHVEIRPASLREVFLALAEEGQASLTKEVIQ